MNIMRKLRGSAANVVNTGAIDENNANTQHAALGLMHLKKLFSEYTHPPQPLSEKEKDDKLYNMLPLFCKVFGNCPSSDMMDKFRDLVSFCQQVSKLMVSEIRRRASNLSTETASCAIAKFLEIEGSEESSNGWMLLSTLNLLAAAGDPPLVQIMTSVSLPSTLVKCLYLFFDLPEMIEPDRTDVDSEFTPRERRILLQKIFVQVLVRLCSHTEPAEELSRKNDLTLLFSAITNSCAPHNIHWRKSAAEVLMTISRHGLTPPVVAYIHSKGCVALCLENMQRGQDLSPLEIVEMFVAVFCFLKDSSEVSQTLLEDFRTCQGYTFLNDFLLKLENDKSAEAVEAMRNLVLMIASLSMCGQNELRPSQASMGSLFQMLGFTLPQPSGRGASVRNIQAFLVLQTLFLKSNSANLCCTILDAISSVYHADNANYFILESQHTLPQFAEKIHLKPLEIQEKFFNLLEFIVFQLNFVPCKELISLSILLKGQNSVSCSIICMKTLLNILKHNVIFKDVYREVGILEVFVTCLQRYSTLLKERQQSQEKNIEFVINPEQENLGMLVIEALTSLLNGNTSNANIFRESGGAKCALNMVLYPECRHQILGIVRELMLNVGGDDDMGTLLALMHGSPAEAIALKGHILKCVLQCLRESHRTRNVFRKVGGFVYILSVIVSMEGSLKNEPQPPWDKFTPQQILSLLHTIFNTITVAMRFEPANAKFFHQEICLTSLCDTLRLLGCFSDKTLFEVADSSILPSTDDTFHNLFIGNVQEPTLPESLPKHVAYACLVIRLLYDVAIDLYDKPNQNKMLFRSPSHKHIEGQKSLESPYLTRRVTSLNLTPPTPDPIIVHSGVVIALFHMIPSIFHQNYPQQTLQLEIYCVEIVKSLVRSERNQQIMCEAGLPAELLSIGSVPLQDENHPLHQPLQYMIERLATQAVEPKDLREFLRLGNPLSCLSYKDLSKGLKGGGAVPLTRVKTLVSMTTPRSQGTNFSPPFTEFDMSAEGFGCLYLPSVAPQSPNGPSVVNVATLTSSDISVVGGIGAGDRMFPPQTGLSYSTWICVERFSDPRSDPHCVRLLTLVRTLQPAKDQHLICLAVVLSARDKAIIITTQETPLLNTGNDWEPEAASDWTARVWCPDLLQEGHWHHLVLVLNRAVLKNSALSIYVDGQHIHTQKLHYISQNPGGGAANLTVASSVYGYIGTPPMWRRYSRLSWKQGPCHLIEEVLSPHSVPIMYQLGPHYLASFQAPHIHGNEPMPPIVAEEKIVFALNAKAVSHLTLAKIRKLYSRADNKSIAKQVGMSSHENATPIRVLHNAAGHLCGAARSLGGVIVGYLGVRVFTPRPVSKVIDSVGGCSVLLGLISMAQDVESLYAGVKALVCVVKSDRVAQCEMDRRRAYQTLAMLLRRKKQILNSHILHLIFSLVGTVDSGRESSSIPNIMAFQDLLCDIEVWHEAPGDLQRSLFEHLYELVAESSEKKCNINLIRQMRLIQRLLYILPAVASNPTRDLMLTLLGALLLAQPDTSDILAFGQFIISTLPCSTTASEKTIILQEPSHTSSGNSFDHADHVEIFDSGEGASSIILRNRCLQLLHSLLFTPRNAVNTSFCEEIALVLGMDWPLLFLQPQLHSSTVIWGLRILVVLCSIPNLMIKFKDGASCGGWLHVADLVLQNRMGVVLAGCQLGSAIPKRESKIENTGTPGFQQLTWLLQHHTDVSQIYFLLMALMMGQPVKLLPADSKLDLLNAWSLLFGVPANQPMASVMGKIVLCAEAVTAMLSMVRVLLSNHIKISSEAESDRVHYAVNIIQFLFLVYHSNPHLMSVFMSQEVLTALANTLFPVTSEPPTPADEVFQPEVARVSSHDNVSNHPAHKFVMDFIRFIIMDSLSLPVTAKSTPPLDIVLECSGDVGNVSDQSRIQTEVLSALMEHLLAADVLLGEQAALSVVQGGCIQNIPSNVSYLAARTVDKLWQGMLVKDPHEVFDFIVKLLTLAKRRQNSNCTETLYHCLNRSILFLLSRGTDTIADQMSVLEALHKLTNNRGLIFGAGNHELEFIGCLTYCLLQLISEMKIIMDANAKTTWHINPQSEESEELTSRQGQNLIGVAARRVWDELYVCKKPAIEEVFKMTLVSSNNKAPDLGSIREQIFELASKIWLNYVDAERKATYKNPWEMHNQIQSKIQKVTGGLTRLASRSKVKKEESLRVKSQISGSGSEIETAAAVQAQVALVKELVDLQAKQHALTQDYTERYVLEEWLQIEAELTRERALWGPQHPSRLDKWMLDMTEGPCRMRKKMMRNDLFYTHYPYRPELEASENKALKYKVASCWDSKEYYIMYRANTIGEHEKLVLEDKQNNQIDNSSDEISNNNGLENLALRRAVKRSVSEPDDANEEGDIEGSGTEDDSLPDNQSILRLLETNEKISHMFRCARIQGLDTMEGLLLFGKEHLYIVDGFTLLKSREIRDIESLPPECYEPILPPQGTVSSSKRQCSKFSYEDIREVHKRRYLLQPMALEVFSSDGRNYLLAFPRKIRNKVYQRFLAFATGIADSAQQSVAGQKRTANVEQGASLLSSLIGETSVTQRWVRGEITNFQYLMHLNTLAGRSYNDLMQYPVFPWILADYDSEILDLTDPTTFRDFTKPMGAQSPERLSQFKKRYKEWDDPHGETPPYHYGTHYSSAMIVCSYLVRMEPFTQHFLRLQGGHFDLADRMFHSIREAWNSASKHNMADVKELIPEFFYLPQFLTNANNFDLGCKQNGVMLGDVVLPPWAKSDPREFIRVHRQALECDYVSQNLHNWIDLIFGCKQQGQAAVEAVNVFHHLFYEGNVDIYNIDDPLKKNATIGFINNFGQIPKQLFKKPHPAKKLGQRVSVLDPNPISTAPCFCAERLFYHNLDNLRPSLHPIKEVKGPVGQIIQWERNVLAVEQNKVLVPPNYSKYVAWGFADHTLRMGNYDSDKAVLTCEAVIHTSGEILACVCPNSKTIITAGTSSVVTIWEYNKKQISVVQTLNGHNEAVTCLATSPAYNVIVSGSRDATAIIWDLSHRIFVRQLIGHNAPVAAVAVNDLTGDIGTCAGTWLHVWSINGEQLCSVNTSVGRADRMQQILCVAFSQCREWDAQNVLLTGSTDGVVRMWSIDYVQVPSEEQDSLDHPKEVDNVNKKIKPPLKEQQKIEEVTKGRMQKRLGKQMKISSVSSDFSVDEPKVLGKSGSESSLSEEGEKSQGHSSDGSSKKKKEPDVQVEEKEKCSDDEVKTEELRKSECISGRLAEVESLSVSSEETLGRIRPSKSDTSLTESFVIVSGNGEEVGEIGPTHTPPLRRAKHYQHILREGFVWQKQLVFRSKLTMHTAYDRKDNSEPASITSLAVSRDHRVVYVGDTRGRVFSWSVADQPGRADHWLKDDGAEACTTCKVKFSIYERRHHCRNCGLLFCSKCSRFESEISRLRILKPVRVCQGCHTSLKIQQH
ncbi:WD repeat and FYVE domain-containing protein 3 isoform X2 [Cimex lectularius]|uniref:WD repeat and FYVE domain-containing protein 3 n=1 Tax=Cimex lectularius TaxID=79782 RepID=A0A8I6SE70_CIMLE|nr:WD repeat and FYVE domain-containing protein 3 isoform X2 [Cimex lectularius]